MIAHCIRCGTQGELVEVIGPDDELLARICEQCVKEYLDSGLDEL